MSGFWLAVLCLHRVSMAFFLGGQIRLAAVARRFGYGSLVALAALLATGVAMATEFSLWDKRTRPSCERSRGDWI